VRIHRLRIFAVLIAVGIANAPSALAVGGGYGPGTGPSDVPGGYSIVVKTQTFGAEGGVLQANIPGGRARLVVPAGAFSQAVQLEVTAPDLAGVEAALPRLHFSGFLVLGGIGVKAYNLDGRPFAGDFDAPLTLTVSGREFPRGVQVIRLSGAASSVPVAAQVSAGAVTVTLLNDPDFALLAPPGATPQTAQPPAATLGTTQHVSTPPGASSTTAPSTTAAATTAPSTSAPASALPQAIQPAASVLGESFGRTGSDYTGAGIAALLLAVLFIVGFVVAVGWRRADNGHGARHRPGHANYRPRHGRVQSSYSRRHGTGRVASAGPQ
jgi:hypothetical protein